VGQLGGCPPGQKCTINDVTTGAVGCVSWGSTADYSLCAANTDCGPTSWCDSTTGVCKPVCTDNAQCGSTGQGLCVTARNGGQNIPGLSVCTAHCHPVEVTPCGDQVNCVNPGSPNDFDCYESGMMSGLFDACSQSRDCVPGQMCGSDSLCVPWCYQTQVGSCCDSCSIIDSCHRCEALGAPPIYDGVTLAACATIPSSC
jgi:hypothetical protein